MLAHRRVRKIHISTYWNHVCLSRVERHNQSAALAAVLRHRCQALQGFAAVVLSVKVAHYLAEAGKAHNDAALLLWHCQPDQKFPVDFLAEFIDVLYCFLLCHCLLFCLLSVAEKEKPSYICHWIYFVVWLIARRLFLYPILLVCLLFDDKDRALFCINPNN